MSGAVIALAVALGAEPALTFYWGVGCPHCEEAEPFVASLEGVARVERVEVRRDPEGRRRILAEVARLGIGAPGIPLFVAGDRWVMGYERGKTDAQVLALLEAAKPPPPAPPRAPLLGEIDPATVPLLPLTAVVGLADGFNPCAFWVLLVLLGLLGRVRSRGRVLLLGGAFVAVSGIVYFGFMTAWSGLFALAGERAWVTGVLGAALLAMGLVNLKDLVWFKAGPSLVIPERAKPALYRRMSGLGARVLSRLAGKRWLPEPLRQSPG